MAAPINFWPEVETGFVIVPEDSGAGMVDVHDRRPVVLEPKDALIWMNLDTPVEEAAHITQTGSIWRNNSSGGRYVGSKPGLP
jgi:putative SOS response-associated peptidase YedK